MNSSTQFYTQVAALTGVSTVAVTYTIPAGSSARLVFSSDYINTQLGFTALYWIRAYIPTGWFKK